MLTHEERQRRDHEEANANGARRLLGYGEVRAGQSLDDFLKLCTPYRIDFVDRYAFIEFYPVPNLTGLTLVATDGKLSSATEWGCVMTRDYSNTFTEEERKSLSSIYDSRLWGSGR
jgi:hypothetical protein